MTPKQWKSMSQPYATVVDNFFRVNWYYWSFGDEGEGATPSRFLQGFAAKPFSEGGGGRQERTMMSLVAEGKKRSNH
jgi:hypothetical protein